MRELRGEELWRWAGRIGAMWVLMAAIYLVRHAIEVRYPVRIPEFQLFYVALIPATLAFGFVAGMAGALFSLYWIVVWIEAPVGVWKIDNPGSFFAIGLHGALCVVTCALVAYLRRKQLYLQMMERRQVLREGRKRLRTLLASINSAVYISDPAGRILDFNEAFLRFHRIEAEEHGPQTVAEMMARNQLLRMDGQPLPEAEWPIRRAMRGERVEDLTLRLRNCATGESWVGLYSSGPILGDGGAIEGAVVSVLDVTRVTASEEALRASETLYRTIFEHSIDALVVSRLSDGLYIDANPAFEILLGYRREEALGRTAKELKVWAHYEQDRMRLAERLQYEPHVREFNVQFRRKNGELFWGAIGVAVFEMDGVQYLLSIGRDISDARRAEEEIRNLAYFDPLTHLANRRMLLEKLERVCAGSQRKPTQHALMFVDLDNFKTLNDTMGHHIGDLLLQSVAERLCDCVRPNDTVGRLGGDEFVLLVEELGPDAEHAAIQARRIAAEVLEKIAEPHWLEGRECTISCSIGTTIFGGEKRSLTELMQQADIAMYQSKAAGRNTQQFFAPELQQVVSERAALIGELRDALRNGEMELFYQAQVRGSHLEGAEALLRWRHPTRGLLGPGVFIGVAEESGLIVPLGQWVLEEACRQMADWNARLGFWDMSIAVNLSALQLRAPDFVAGVLETIRRQGARAEQLELELTESALVENMEEGIARMTALRDAGVRFAIDDFGTGYSSLSYLKQLPISRLKISQSFLTDLLTDDSSRMIARTIVSLGAAMQVDVIAEGVELEDQQRMLCQMGCNCFQGYLFSRPVPASDFEDLVQEYGAGGKSR